MEIDIKLATAVERMPAFPRSVQRVIELTRDINVDAKDIVDVIEKDPVMTVKILRVINSAFYALPRKIASIQHAVVMLGINTVKNMALSFAAAGMLPARNDAGFDTEQYLLHSLATAGTARLVAQKLGDTDTPEAYIAGLLHAFGKILFARHMPEAFRAALDRAAEAQISLHQAEQDVLGVDHTVAGAMLAAKWQFPQELIDCIRDHHQPPPAGGLGRVLFIANQLVKAQDVGSAGNLLVEPLPTGLAGKLGDDYEAIAGSLTGLDKILNEARAFSASGGSEA